MVLYYNKTIPDRTIKYNNDENLKEFKFSPGDKIPELANTIYCYNISNQGGFSSVNKIYDTKYKKYYALKIPKKNFVNNREILRMFFDESNKLANMNINNYIVNYKQFINWNNIPLIVTEFINGFTLNKIIKNSNEYKIHFLKITDYLGAFIEIARGMEYLHKNYNILHLDLKSSNIMYDIDNNNLKIIDFGISKVFSELKNSPKKQLIIGTYPYMSPEHFSGIQNCTKLSDIYSYGIILYEIITGNKPFNADSRETYAKLHNNIDINYIPGCIDKLEQIITKCLKKNPQERYQSFSSILNDLEVLYEEISKSKYPLKNNLALTPKNLLIHANKYYNSGQYEKALNIINKINQIDNKNEEALLIKALIYYRKRKYLNSLTLIVKLLKQNPKDTILNVILGHLYMQNEEYKKAIKFYEYVLSVAPNSFNYIKSNLAECYFYLLEITKSENIIDSALKIESRNFDFISFKSKLLFYTNNIQKTQKFLESFLTFDWNGNFHTMWGNILNDSGKGDKALPELVKYISSYPNSPNVFNIIGNIYLKNKNYKKSSKYFKKAFILSKNNYSYLHNYLFCLGILGMTDEIIDLYNILIKNNKYNSELHNIFGNIFLSLRKFKKAHNSLSICLKLEPENPNFLSDLIVFYIETKRFDIALSTVNKWKLKYKLNSNLLNTIGLLHYRQKNYDEAEKSYIAAIDKMPYNSVFASNLINIYMETNNYEKGIEYYKDWVKNKRACEHLNFAMGNLYLKQNLYCKSEVFFSNSVKIDPYNFVFLKSYLFSLIKQGIYSNLLSIFQKWVKKFNDVDKSYYSNELGVILLQNRNYLLASKLFKYSVDCDPENINSSTNYIHSLGMLNKGIEAIKFSTRWLHAKNTTHEFWNQLGYIYHFQNNYEKSYDCFSKAIHLCPDSHESARYLMYSIVKLKKYTEGITFANKWKAKYPIYDDMENLLGLCYYNTDKYRESFRIFSKILKPNINNPYYFSNYLCSLINLKKIKISNKLLENWLKKYNPNDYFYGTLGNCYYNISHYLESAEFYKSALKINSKNELYAHNYFKILRLMNKDNEALSFVTSWELENSLSSSFLNQVGLCYFEQNQYEQSVGYFNEAVLREPSNGTFSANYILSLININDLIIAKYFAEDWLTKYSPNEDFNKAYSKVLAEILV